MIFKWFSILFLLFLQSTLFSQEASSSSYIENMLSKVEAKGINKGLFRERLLAVGIDLKKMNIEELKEHEESIVLIMESLLARQIKEISTLKGFSDNYSKNIRKGQRLFSESASVEILNIKPQESYILGAGDELNISIFGASQFDARFKINAAGFIQPTRMAKIFLKGVTLGQAKELIASRFARNLTFRKEQCIISLITPREIAVQVTGEVKKTGTHTFVGTKTAIDVLKTIGGPSEIGSMRHIQLIRGKQKKTIDLYNIMQDPSLAYNYTLEEGDIIFVPIAKKVVEIQGSIRKPMIYEIKEGEGLFALINLAGGLAADAYKKMIQVKRYGAEREEIIDIQLESIIEELKDFNLQNGDIVKIKSITSEVENFVTISGGVTFPGSYSLNTTPTIYSLIEKGGLQKEARRDNASLVRFNPDGTKKLIPINLDSIMLNPKSSMNKRLQKADNLIVYKQERFVDEKTIKVSGAVREALEYPFDPAASITIERAIFLAGGLKADAADMGFIIRQNPQNAKEKEYVKVAIKKALENPDGEANIKLAPFDELKILSNSTFSDAATVKIMGAVRNPGKFPFHKSLSINDLIVLSGGLSFDAALNRVDLFRVQTQGNDATKTIVKTIELDSTFQQQDSLIFLEPFDELVVRKIPEFEFQKYVEIKGEVKYPGKYALLNDSERLTSVLERSGGLNPEAYAEGASIIRAEENKGLIVSNIKEALLDSASKFNYILKEGDVITVPKQYNLVTISVANTRAFDLYPADFLSNNWINVAHEEKRKAKWYIKEYAAGVDRQSRNYNISVRHQNGELRRTRSFAFINFYPKVKPGSVVTVANTFKKSKKDIAKKIERQRVNWEKLLSNVFQSVTLSVTTVLLVKQL